MIGLFERPEPSRRPIRFPPASCDTLKPAPANSLRNHARASSNSGENARRVHGTSGRVNWLSRSTRAFSRSALIGGKAMLDMAALWFIRPPASYQRGSKKRDAGNVHRLSD